MLADTGITRSLNVTPPTMSVSVSVGRVAPAHAGVPEPPVPDAEPSVPPPGAGSETAGPAAASPGARPEASASARLEPPVLLHPGTLVDVRWAAGDADTALVNAARRCAAAMEFAPARLAGRAVEVWCRQRFEFVPR